MWEYLYVRMLRFSIHVYSETSGHSPKRSCVDLDGGQSQISLHMTLALVLNLRFASRSEQAICNSRSLLQIAHGVLEVRPPAFYVWLICQCYMSHMEMPN